MFECGKLVVKTSQTFGDNGQLQITERERTLVRVLSARDLVLCFRPLFRAHVICQFKLKTISLAFVIMFFFFKRNFREKHSVMTPTLLYKNNTLVEEDVLTIFNDQ